MYSQEFTQALVSAFAVNEAAGRGPASFRALAKRMVELSEPGEEPSHRQIEQQRRALRRYASGERVPSQQTVELAARALGCEVPSPPSRSRLRERVAELERENERLREQLAREDHLRMS